LRRLITKLSDHYADFEENNRSITAYAQMENHPGWSIHKEMLLLLRGLVAEDLLSKKFTELDATEKDVQQRAYSMVDDFIQFLLNPLAQAKHRAQLINGRRTARNTFSQGFDREMTKRK
jgi:hypothetical protein